MRSSVARKPGTSRSVRLRDNSIASEKRPGQMPRFFFSDPLLFPISLQKKVTHLEQRLRDSLYLLATEAALAAIVAISLRTLASRIPTELRRALAVDAAEDTADSVLSKPLPRLEEDSEDGNAAELVEKVRKLVDELRLTGEALSAKAKARYGHTTELRKSSGTERPKRQLRIRRDEKP